MVHAVGGGEVDSGGEDVVAGLAAIDVVVGMRAGEAGDDLVGVHVGGGAAAGLVDVQREMVVVLAGGDGVGRGFDGRGAG